MFRRMLNHITNKIYDLPVIVLMPHSRCNCRCVMCDIWKANHNKQEIPAEELMKHLEVFRKLGVREVVLSGGEALMHSNLWALCRLLKEAGIRNTLLSTGLLLEKNAENVVKYFDGVIISIDGSEEVHDKIRNVPSGFAKLASGVRTLKALRPSMRITGRCVLQKLNYRDFKNIVKASRQIGLDQISFLAADVSTAAFNHDREAMTDSQNMIVLDRTDVSTFDEVIDEAVVGLKEEFESRFIAENPEKIRRIVDYYRAMLGEGEFKAPPCNAPWVSAVIESNGDVMPCFFHKPYGNIYNASFDKIINSAEAKAFRRTLNTAENPVCKKCVCSLKLGIMG